MKVLAVITDPLELDKILRHLAEIGRAPPGLDISALQWTHLVIVGGRDRERRP